jgi:N-acetylglucosaminyldiphosphoundecaprenol N-acetyl-beta-D-mannosaminyltransferase
MNHGSQRLPEESSGVPGERVRVLSIDVSTGSFEDLVRRIVLFGSTRTSSYVCCVNAHMVVEAWRGPAFEAILEAADVASPDGMPIVYSMRLLHGLKQERVAGNDLMPAVIARAEAQAQSVFFFGSTQAVLDGIEKRLETDHPNLRVAGTYSPPFRDLTDAEMSRSAKEINASGANIVFVSLGCPRQERWMAAMKGRIDTVMLGVGGAFPLYAGVDSRAPEWLRNLSLEWSYRLALEPRRLWKRYLVTNSIFLWLLLRELAGRTLRRSGAS